MSAGTPAIGGHAGGFGIHRLAWRPDPGGPPPFGLVAVAQGDQNLELKTPCRSTSTSAGRPATSATHATAQSTTLNAAATPSHTKRLTSGLYARIPFQPCFSLTLTKPVTPSGYRLL